MWVFVLPYAAALAFVLVVQWYAQRKSAVVGRVVYPLGWVFVIIGAVWSSVLARDPASEGLIFRSADQYWRSSLGSAVIRFGVTDHPGAVGYPVRYHWLGEAQMGFLGLLSNTPIVDIVVRFSALGATFAAVLGVFVLARQIGLGRLEGYFAAILLAVLSTLLYSYGLNILKTTEMGQLWGTAFFLNGIALLLLFLRASTIRSGVFVGWGVIVISMVNSTLGIVFASATLVVLFFMKLRKQITGRAWLTTSLLVGGAIVALGATLLSSTSESSFSPTFGFGSFFDYAPVFGYRGSNELVKLVTVVALIGVLWFQSGASLGLRRLRQRCVTNPLAQDVFETVAAVGVGLAGVIVIAGIEQYRFVLPILILGPLVAAGYVSQAVREIRNAPHLVITLLILVSATIGLYAQRFMSKAFGEAAFMVPRLAFVVAMIGAPVLFWALAALWVRARRHQTLIAPQLATFFVVAAVVTSVAHTSRETMAQYQYSRELSAPSVVNADRYECLNFLRDNSPTEAIIASTMWRWGADEFTEKWYIATAVAERRAYIDGPLYVQNPRSTWLSERVELTKRFAAAPASKDLEALISVGVDYFVIDKAWPHTMNWEGFGSVRFNNEACAVIELDQSAN